MSDWDDLARWWSDEVTDPAYESDVQPLVDALTAGLEGPTVDLGCGNGRLLARLPAPAYGIDSSSRLLSDAAAAGASVVLGRLPQLGFLRQGLANVAVACLVLEHILDAAGFFAEAHRIVAPGGALVVVSNHPAFTAESAGPVIDQSDGEVLWRWGTYLFESIAVEPAGDGTVIFHHRPMASLLSTAAAAGWVLERMIEQPAGAATITRVPALVGQEHMPRLVGWRWRAADAASSGPNPSA